MNKSSWRQIEADLRSRKPLRPKNDAESFRQDFKARASLMRQDVAEEPALSTFPFLNWRYISATAAALLIMGFFMWPSSVPLVTQVKSLQIIAPHSGVMIMTDEETPGTVVWVTDLESDSEGKG